MPKILQRYGVWADWSNPYLTLDPEYEASQVKLAHLLDNNVAFLNFVQNQIL